jgi:RHS repeat-associated protein
MVVNRSGSALTPFTYVGAYGVMDEGNGLYFMTNRYYDSVTGRFLQKDPIGFAGGQTNLYAYVGGNPVGSVDPVGLLPMDGGGGAERWIIAVQQMDPETKKAGAIVGVGIMSVPTAVLILPELIAPVAVDAVTTSSACATTVATSGSSTYTALGMNTATDKLLRILLTDGVDVVETIKALGSTAIGRDIIIKAATRAEMMIAASGQSGNISNQLAGLANLLYQFRTLSW